jgi:hypothetical protein
MHDPVSLVLQLVQPTGELADVAESFERLDAGLLRRASRGDSFLDGGIDVEADFFADVGGRIGLQAEEPARPVE